MVHNSPNTLDAWEFAYALLLPQPLEMATLFALAGPKTLWALLLASAGRGKVGREASAWGGAAEVCGPRSGRGRGWARVGQCAACQHTTHMRCCGARTRGCRNRRGCRTGPGCRRRRPAAEPGWRAWMPCWESGSAAGQQRSTGVKHASWSPGPARAHPVCRASNMSAGTGACAPDAGGGCLPRVPGCDPSGMRGSCVRAEPVLALAETIKACLAVNSHPPCDGRLEEVVRCGRAWRSSRDGWLCACCCENWVLGGGYIAQPGGAAAQRRPPRKAADRPALLFEAEVRRRLLPRAVPAFARALHALQAA